MTKSARALALAVAFVGSIGCSGGKGGGSTGPGCEAGQHACGATCVSDTSPLTCGTRCEPCSAPAHAEATCSTAGACGIQCASGYTACDSGCCAVGGAGLVVFGFTWPTGGTLAAATRLEVRIGQRVLTLDAPATSASVDGLDAGPHVFAARLLNGEQVLARGGGVAFASATRAFQQEFRAGSAGLARCGVADDQVGEDVVIDLAGTRTLAVAAADEDGVALLLPPEELVWTCGNTPVAAIDAVTGAVTPAGAGYASIGVTCGQEIANKPGSADAAVTAAVGAIKGSAVVFVRDGNATDAAPVAALAIDPLDADYDFTFRMDASGSTDDGPASALRWRFDWEGDGTWDTAFGSSSLGFHKYAWAEAFRPTVQVVDAGGRTGRKVVDLAVAVPTGVRVSIDMTSFRFYLGLSRQPTFTATVTGAGDTSVTWSMLEAGTGRAGGCLTQTGTTCLYDPGIYGGVFHLVATANADPRKKAMAEITVINQPPSANCHAEYANASWAEWAILGQPLVFDAELSRDPESGYNLTYAWWYLDNNVGPRISIPGTGPTLSFGFDVQGPQTVGLDVTDPGGEGATGTCGTVTWAAAHGLPVAQGSQVSIWDSPGRTLEVVFVGSGAGYNVASCARDAVNNCWVRQGSVDGCSIVNTGIAATHLECGSGTAWVSGPEIGSATTPNAPYLWVRWSPTPAEAWLPLRDRNEKPLSAANAGLEGDNCWSGPFCP